MRWHAPHWEWSGRSLSSSHGVPTRALRLMAAAASMAPSRARIYLVGEHAGRRGDLVFHVCIDALELSSIQHHLRCNGPRQARYQAPCASLAPADAHAPRQCRAEGWVAVHQPMPVAANARHREEARKARPNTHARRQGTCSSLRPAGAQACPGAGPTWYARFRSSRPASTAASLPGTGQKEWRTRNMRELAMR